ncbi:MAG: hypothetical protein CL940_11015 [Deltaproteobacteria bacterium]|nr:hypothetical protein [Deltaproteobacteria bacterium]
MNSAPTALTIGVAILLCAGFAPPALSQAQAEPVKLGDLCRLIEGLPGAKDPVRRAATFRRAIRGLQGDLRSTTEGRELSAARASKHLKSLEAALAKTLAQARKAFRRGEDEAWGRSHQSRAKKFLKGQVFNRSAVLRVGEFGFEPSPPVRASLMWAACWAGDATRLITYGRGATHADEGGARAMAALTLLQVGRTAEAKELLESLTGESFLAAYAQSKLAKSKERRRRQRALAKRRATTPWQRASLGLEPLVNEGAP